MFLGFLKTASSCALNITLKCSQWGLLFCCTVIFCVVSICISLMNSRNHHHCMRLKYMHKVRTVVEGRPEKQVSVMDMGCVSAEVGGLSLPLSVVSNNSKFCFVQKDQHCCQY